LDLLDDFTVVRSDLFNLLYYVLVNNLLNGSHNLLNSHFLDLHLNDGLNFLNNLHNLFDFSLNWHQLFDNAVNWDRYFNWNNSWLFNLNDSFNFNNLGNNSLDVNFFRNFNSHLNYFFIFFLNNLHLCVVCGSRNDFLN
jgi:hypothetical protein